MLYLNYIGFAFVIDEGAQVFQFWHYTYNNFFEYLLLYLMIYPFGGFVMLFSYFLVNKIPFTKGKTRNLPHHIFIKIFSVSLLLFVIFALLIFIGVMPSRHWIVFLAVWFLILTGTLVSLISERLNRTSYIRDYFNNPLKVLFVTFIATYLNTIVHEYPNLYGKEWIYTTHTYSFFDNLFLGVPLNVWITWPTLAVGPLAIYYMVQAFVKKK